MRAGPVPGVLRSGACMAFWPGPTTMTTPARGQQQRTDAVPTTRSRP